MSDDPVKKTTITLPARLHQRLVSAAERDHRSMHGQILAYIERGLDQDEDQDHGKGS
jgi:predicted DNA-binding protein